MKRQHIDEPDCWCNPTLLKNCDDCDGKGCWKCKDGLGPASADEDGIIVVHQETSE